MQAPTGVPAYGAETLAALTRPDGLKVTVARPGPVGPVLALQPPADAAAPATAVRKRAALTGPGVSSSSVSPCGSDAAGARPRVALGCLPASAALGSESRLTASSLAVAGSVAIAVAEAGVLDKLFITVTASSSAGLERHK